MPDTRIWAFFAFCLAVLWAGILVGVRIHSTRARTIENEDKIITVLEGALLTLFGLLMGFTFSMAVSRYDMRKLLVVTEANSIGTTWLRTAILQEPVRTQEQDMLREYMRLRLLFHTEFRRQEEFKDTQEQIDAVQGRMWGIASNYATDHKDILTSLFLQSLNQTIDVETERTAADENRIPVEAWAMLVFVGFVSTVVVGTKIGRRSWVLQSVLPIVLAMTLTMTLDLDSPRFGLIRINQLPMEKVARNMTRPPQQVP